LTGLSSGGSLGAGLLKYISGKGGKKKD